MLRTYNLRLLTPGQQKRLGEDKHRNKAHIADEKPDHRQFNSIILLTRVEREWCAAVFPSLVDRRTPSAPRAIADAGSLTGRVHHAPAEKTG